jgi:hypothetical protein
MIEVMTNKRQQIEAVKRKAEALFPLLHEKARRRWAACEARAIGYGGITIVAAATGLSRPTIRRGLVELDSSTATPEDSADEQEDAAGRIRRPGAGRPLLTQDDPNLVRDLQQLVDPATRGDPMSPLLWTCKSTRNLADALNAQGHAVSHQTVARLLRALDYRLQANRKTLEGQDLPDRDAQFQHINRKVRSFQRRGQPVVSMDGKKKELVGTYKNPGRQWEPKGQPTPVKSKDFPDKDLGKVAPYGVYDLTAKEGWVSVGVSHETAAFAVQTLRYWFTRMGHRRYPEAEELLITVDAGGSNGLRNRLWKWSLQGFANETGLKLSICHFPPGTSKWNKIEHQLFCRITENWRGRPLISHAVVVNLIGSTKTREGLRVEAALDTRAYPEGIEVPDKEWDAIRLVRSRFHGDWNYQILPRDPEVTLGKVIL